MSPGKQALTGPETAIYYTVINMEDELLSNADLRRALSLAINRQAIADTVYEGTRQPATGIVPAGPAIDLLRPHDRERFAEQSAPLS